MNFVRDKLEIHGVCTEDKLFTLLERTSIDFMLMDVEGAEMDLLSDRNVRALRYSVILIESHDFCIPGCLSALTKPFRSSHQLMTAVSEQENSYGFPIHIIHAK